jgi:hypothetical protein
MTPEEAEGIRLYCDLQGFDLPRFDAWLATLEGVPVHRELTERRTLALAAIRANDEQRALRHLEWMLLRWRWIKRSDALVPMAMLGAERSKQLSAFAAKGNASRRKFTAADKQQWRDLVASDADLKRLRETSARGCAMVIARRLGLDSAAVETIRRVI